MSLTEREKEIVLECGRKYLGIVREESIQAFAKECFSRICEESEKGYVKDVPDHCDRIVWKGRYYHLNNMTPDCSELVEALEHILEYWNKDTNEDAMADAPHHIEYSAGEALANHTKRMKGGE